MKKSIFALIFMLIFVVSCQQAPVEPTPTVVVETAVSTQPSADPTTAPPSQGLTILADGTVVAPIPVLPLGFTTNGQLLDIRVAPGDTVQAGDIIATLDDSALQDAVAAAGASLAIVQAQLDQQQAPPDAATIASAEHQIVLAQSAIDSAQANRSGLFTAPDNAAIIEAESALVTARINWEQVRDGHEQLILNDILGDVEEQARQQAEAAYAQYQAAEARLNQLRHAGPTSASIQGADVQITQAEANLANAEEQLAILLADTPAVQIAVLEAQVAQAQLNRDQAQRALDNATLTAPWSGTILTVEAASGAFIGAGSPVVSMLDQSQLEFHTTNLSERDLAQISIDTQVEIILKAFPNDPLVGTVTRIGVQANGVVGDAAVFPIIISINDTPLEIRPGMTGRAEIEHNN
ncbi:MAG: HlyD family efflux transporter periplasmic adaptor subunit [Chloroflexi bacterium]|nr:HlyD family efflux transporter periplasmic adaptor subunit [Chloroflexota bacterium]